MVLDGDEILFVGPASNEAIRMRNSCLSWSGPLNLLYDKYS